MRSSNATECITLFSFSPAMKTMQCKTSISFLSFFLISFLVSVHALDPATFCSYSLYPDFCKALVSQNSSATVRDLGRNSIYDSILRTKSFSYLVNNYLNPSYNFSETTNRALQDCKSLFALNDDFLSTTLQHIRYTDSLQNQKAEDLQTLLSAAQTNHETCFNSLQEAGVPPSVYNALYAPWSNGRMSNSVALDFFRRGWGSSVTSWPWFWFFSPVPIGLNASRVVYVNPNPGPGQKADFSNITAAVSAAPNNTVAGSGYYVISIAEGVYEEYVSIPKNKKYIMMVGAGINKTIITGNRSVVDGWTTFNSASFAVVAQSFVAQKITFRNTAGPIKHQAVALRSGADLSAFYQCSFEGYQDTLYTHSMRQFYKECDIYGTVDFIFGNAAVVLQDCNIYPRLPMPGQFNTVTAQGRTDINQNTGTSIQGCTVKPAPDLASSDGTTQTYLGRPWKTYSRTVVMQSELDSFINPVGWAEWSGNTSLDTLYYAEYSNTGPGADTSNRVNWPGFHLIDATDAGNFTVANLIQGNEWLNGTGVPYKSSLN